MRNTRMRDGSRRPRFQSTTNVACTGSSLAPLVYPTARVRVL
jgi:hypothetical protein